MSNIVDFPKQEPSEEEAAFDQAGEWIAKIDRGLSEDERGEIQRWLSVANHRKILFQMATIWDKMEDLNRLADLFEVPASKAEPRGLPAATLRRYMGYSGALAAAVLLAVLVVFVKPLISSDHKVFRASYVTAKGEHSTFNLQDGSTLVLNTNARVDLMFTPEQRLLILKQGEMNIEVAHDASRPLNVKAGGKIVQAVGTAFNIQINANKEVELIVTDGKVRVENASAEAVDKPIGRLPSSSMTVAKGEKVLLGSANEKVVRMKDSDIAVDLGWRQGNLIFRGETLEEALAEVTRYTDVKFEISDNNIRQTHIAGLFKVGDIDGLLATLNKNFNISSERVGEDKVVLKAE